MIYFCLFLIVFTLPCNSIIFYDYLKRKQNIDVYECIINILIICVEYNDINNIKTKIFYDNEDFFDFCLNKEHIFSKKFDGYKTKLLAPLNNFFKNHDYKTVSTFKYCEKFF